jgi:acyl-coenzyme A thioesterase PaaI-like protein
MPRWFSADLGHRHHYADDGAGVVEMKVIPELCVPGTRMPRIAVLATLADIAAGSLVQPDLTPYVPLTVDLDVHCDGVLDMDELVCTARTVKLGRIIQVVDNVFTDAGAPDRPLARSTVRFIRSTEPSPLLVDHAILDFSGVEGNMLAPIADQLRMRVTGPGEAAVDRWSYVLQPTGTIQGGALTLLAELAAESALGAPVVDIDVHFLNAVRQGPARATATPQWESLAQVEIRDEGNRNRLVATATATATRT